MKKNAKQALIASPLLIATVAGALLLESTHNCDSNSGNDSTYVVTDSVLVNDSTDIVIHEDSVIVLPPIIISNPNKPNVGIETDWSPATTAKTSGNIHTGVK